MIIWFVTLRLSFKKLQDEYYGIHFIASSTDKYDPEAFIIYNITKLILLVIKKKYIMFIKKVYIDTFQVKIVL